MVSETSVKKKKSDSSKRTSSEAKGDESPASKKGGANGELCEMNGEKGDSPLLKKSNVDMEEKGMEVVT